jgi:radical SAM protein with 4Fe4S-binding SPASM domain
MTPPKTDCTSCSAGICGLEPNAFPSRLKLEISTVCNLQCGTCLLHSLERRDRLMPLNRIRQVISDVRPSHINLTGFGEPTLHPEFAAVVSEVKKRKEVHLRFFTNGLSLTPELSSFLVNKNVDLIIVSLDAIEKTAYERARGADSFDRAATGLSNLLAARERKGNQKPAVWTNFVITSTNIHELPDYVRKTPVLFPGAVPHAELVDLSGLPDQARLYLPSPETESILSTTISIARDHHFETLERSLRLARRRLRREYDHRPLARPLPCYYVSRNLTVTVDGDVVPCQLFQGLEATQGNVFRDLSRQIWLSESFVKLRRKLAHSRAVYGPCGTCRFECCQMCAPPDA